MGIKVGIVSGNYRSLISKMSPKISESALSQSCSTRKQILSERLFSSPILYLSKVPGMSIGSGS